MTSKRSNRPITAHMVSQPGARFNMYGEVVRVINLGRKRTDGTRYTVCVKVDGEWLESTGWSGRDAVVAYLNRESATVIRSS